MNLRSLRPERPQPKRFTPDALPALLLVLLVCQAAAARTVKISTWNLEWLTTRTAVEADLPADVHLRAPQDFALLRHYAEHLNADVVAFQEVDGDAAAATVFDPARYTILSIDEPVVQRVGLAVRRGIAVRRNPDYTQLDVEPGEKHRLRYGLDATLTLPGGATLRVLVVNLKTGCQRDPIARSSRLQCAILRAQIPPLAAWAAARQAEGVAFLLIGDFNRVFDHEEEMGRALAAAAPLLRVTEGRSDPCWDGSEFIDHIFAGGPARAWVVPGSLRVQIFHETGPEWRERLSDHCPISINLQAAPPPD
jgi:endonuclease/exonuclease/phosphatase family metal-dependent hydrolase